MRRKKICIHGIVFICIGLLMGVCAIAASYRVTVGFLMGLMVMFIGGGVMLLVARRRKARMPQWLEGYGVQSLVDTWGATK